MVDATPALVSKELGRLNRLLIYTTGEFRTVCDELQSVATAKGKGGFATLHSQNQLDVVFSAMRDFRDGQAHLDTCLAALASCRATTEGEFPAAVTAHPEPDRKPIILEPDVGAFIAARRSTASPKVSPISVLSSSPLSQPGGDTIATNANPKKKEEKLSNAKEKEGKLACDDDEDQRLHALHAVSDGGRRSSAIGKYLQTADVERSVYITGFPSHWDLPCREEIISCFGPYESFERVELSKHSRTRGELVVFNKKAQARHVEGLLDHMQIGKHHVSAGPPPVWLQKQRNASAPEDTADAKKNRLILNELLVPYLLSSYFMTGQFQRTWIVHKNLVTRIMLGYAYPLLLHTLMLYCIYACFEEAFLEFDSDQAGSAANAMRSLAFGTFFFTSESIRYSSAVEFLRPVSDSSLLRIMMLNIRPGTSDVVYVRHIVKLLTWKGNAGVLLWAVIPLFSLWRENLGQDSFFVAQEPTPRLFLISVAFFVASSNVQVTFTRTALYSLLTRCV
jgi:hypothetical protein